MNEPDEDLESTLPEEPLPEPDALLDALVDAETEATPRRRTSKTLIAALVLSGLGIWQIVHVNNGGEPLFQLAARAKAGPTKLHSDGRIPIGKVLPSTDPIATYLERAKRGMTDQEIRWMIEDFEVLKLDETADYGYSEGFHRAQRTKQIAWYLKALDEALCLSAEQRSQAHDKLKMLLETDLKLLADKWQQVEDQGGLMLALDVMKFENPDYWLSDESCAPWNLCDLTKEQSQLTLQRWKVDTESTGLKKPVTRKVDYFEQVASSMWIRLDDIAMQDPTSGNLVEYPPPSAFDLACTMYGTAKGGIIKISDAFPLTLDQKLEDHRLDLAAQARLLQPAQLRLAMLLSPKLSNSIQQQLDNSQSIIEPATDAGITTENADELPPNTVESENPVDPEEQKESE